MGYHTVPSEATPWFTQYLVEHPARRHYKFMTKELQLQIFVCLEWLLSAKTKINNLDKQLYPFSVP